MGKRDPKCVWLNLNLPFSRVLQYLETVNLNLGIAGGRDIGITALYTVAMLLLVFLFMWFRSRPIKKSAA